MRIKVIWALAPILCLAGAFALAESWARSNVPRSDRTPYRTSPIEGLPSILGPNLDVIWQGSKIHTNSHGFRGPEITDPGPAQQRIALVGDSFVFGSGVEWEDTLGEQIEVAMEDRGRSVQVLNFGVPGYNTGHSAVVVETTVLDFDPDVVIYVAFANDTDPHRSYGEIDPDRIPDPIGQFMLRSAFGQRCLIILRDMAAHFDVLLSRHSHENQSRYYQGPAGARVKAGMKRMRELCQAADVPLMIAIYPFMVAPDRNPYLIVEQCIARDGFELGLPVVRIDRAFAGADRRKLWAHPIHDSHPNREANGLAAGFMAGVLDEFLSGLDSQQPSEAKGD